MEILKIENLSKSFNGTKALKNISLSLKKGEIHGIVGIYSLEVNILEKLVAMRETFLSITKR